MHKKKRHSVNLHKKSFHMEPLGSRETTNKKRQERGEPCGARLAGFGTEKKCYFNNTHFCKKRKKHSIWKRVSLGEVPFFFLSS